ncbi:phage terminase small subunit P27 family [Vermiculatibacterium agrestimuris]|uniref:phage terminase small subunit P27 family n=1 Tax=Vermiculatibacterium agrestimuris TaxID=2941519 RepID=UPI002041747F|nr:phage terminase small subunit P27 family [Vermiculatibacterium agrestimuris]
MGKQKEPIALVEAKGRKHLTKAEKAEREASEPVLSAPASGEGSKIRAPVWLPAYLRDDFNDLRTQLVEAGIFSKLDRDTLGRYLVAQRQYTAAMRQVSDALDAQDVEAVAAWGKEQERCFKQCRACAADLGLTISARCRLVIPEALRPKEDPEEAAFLKLLEGRRRDA